MASYRFLIADDSLFSRMNLRMMLESNGHQVVGEAPDGVEALEVYKTSKPDVVAMDLNMPKCNGVDAIRNIVAVDPGARFIVVSAVDRRLVADQCSSLGICEYVSKPVEWPKLQAAIDNVMKAPARHVVRGKEAKEK